MQITFYASEEDRDTRDAFVKKAEANNSSYSAVLCRLMALYAAHGEKIFDTYQNDNQRVTSVIEKKSKKK